MYRMNLGKNYVSRDPKDSKKRVKEETGDTFSIKFKKDKNNNVILEGTGKLSSIIRFLELELESPIGISLDGFLMQDGLITDTFVEHVREKHYY